MVVKMAAFSPATRWSIIVGGAAIWGLLFALVGTITERPLAGAICGVVLGAIIGLGYTKRQIGNFVVWATEFALVGMVLGPACDGDPMSSAVAAVLYFCLFRFVWWLLISINYAIFPKEELDRHDK
jgi:hypothetical protein